MAVSESFGNVNSWGGYWAIQKSNSCWKNISLANSTSMSLGILTKLRVNGYESF